MYIILEKIASNWKNGYDEDKKDKCAYTGTYRKKYLAPVKVATKSKQPLLILSLTMPRNLFIEKTLVTQCILKKNQIQLQALLDTSAIGIAFIDKAMACHMCEILQIF